MVTCEKTDDPFEIVTAIKLRFVLEVGAIVRRVNHTRGVHQHEVRSRSALSDLKLHVMD